MKIPNISFPENFWSYYRLDLEKFLKAPRSVLFGFYLTTVIAMSYLITPWCFVLLILPFLYSLLPAYQISTDDSPLIAVA